MNYILSYNDWSLNEMHMSTNNWTEEDHKEWAKLNMENLAKLSEILFKNRCNWWVDCGTLLGIHRDKSLIQGDSDTDCGIDVESITPELLKDLEPHFGKGDGGMFWDYNDLVSALDDDNYYAIKSIKFCGLKNKNGQPVKFKGVPVMCDLFIYYPNGKDMIYKYGSDYFRGKTDHLKGSTTFQFQGIKLKKPSNTEGHLECVFGKGWKEPDPQFSPKTTTVYGGPIKQKDFGGRYMYNFKTRKNKIA